MIRLMVRVRPMTSANGLLLQNQWHISLVANFFIKELVYVINLCR